MFKRDWLNGFAFGLIAGFLLTPALIFAAIFFGVSPDDFSQSNGQPDSGEQEGPEDARWWLIRGVVYMDDTAAQWVMMFATIFAAYLLLRTLWATQKMANDTREIGEAQSRAYLKSAKVRCKNTGRNATSDIFMLDIETENLGQSPAKNIEITVDIDLLGFDGTRLAKPIQLTPPIDPSMAPRGTKTIMLSFLYSHGAADEVRASKAFLRFTVTYAYDDVFGRRERFVTYHHTEGGLIDTGVTASHIVGLKPENKAEGK